MTSNRHLSADYLSGRSPYTSEIDVNDLINFSVVDLRDFGFHDATAVMQQAVEFRSSVFVALGGDDNLLI